MEVCDVTKLSLLWENETAQLRNEASQLRNETTL